MLAEEVVDEQQDETADDENDDDSIEYGRGLFLTRTVLLEFNDGGGGASTNGNEPWYCSA